MKRLIVILILVGTVTAAWARPAPELEAAIRQVFTPADDGRSFRSSQAPLDMGKVRGLAVIKRAGIPAGQAYWFITHQDYEYRPFIITGDIGKTYLGKVDVQLQPGTIMAIVSTEIFQKTVEIKLLSKDVVAEKGEAPIKRDTRAAVAMVFKFPGLSMMESDAPAILAKIQEYIAPADSLAQAEEVATRIQGGAPAAAPKVVAKSAEKPASPPVAAIAPPPAARAIGVVQTGMSMEEVRRIKGEPERILNRGGATTYHYGDHDVIFVQGRVNDIRWK